MEAQLTVLQGMLASANLENLKESASSQAQSISAEFTGAPALKGADEDFAKWLSNCANQANSAVSTVGDQRAESRFRELADDCGPHQMKQRAETFKDSVINAVKDCGVDSASDALKGIDKKDLQMLMKDVKTKNEKLSDCLKPIGRSVNDLSDKASQFGHMMATVTAVCSSIPDPYVCGGLMVIAILQSLFGDGDGDGDGENGEAPNGSGGGCSGADCCPPGQNCDPSSEGPPANMLKDGTGCTVSGEDMVCQGHTFEKVWGKAQFDSKNEASVFFNDKDRPIVFLQNYVKEKSLTFDVGSTNAVVACLLKLPNKDGGVNDLRHQSLTGPPDGQRLTMIDKGRGVYGFDLAGPCD
ncbi:MAG: hypothetical protein H6985_05095 [Pseudomonadales bacterium]|nr:hypothetical protein [Pseudomonadales bacterium]